MKHKIETKAFDLGFCMGKLTKTYWVKEENETMHEHKKDRLVPKYNLNIISPSNTEYSEGQAVHEPASDVLISGKEHLETLRDEINILLAEPDQNEEIKS